MYEKEITKSIMLHILKSHPRKKSNPLFVLRLGHSQSRILTQVAVSIGKMQA
jgi:hypothetical protein